jgi:hypothetical protein
MALALCIAGATGWAGRALVPAVLEAHDLALRSAVSRSAAGRDLGEALGTDELGVPVYGNVREALEGVDVLIDYTSATVVKGNALAAIDAGATLLDASVGGLGGCPYAPGATGNLATEDLIYMLDHMGIETDVRLDRLVAASMVVAPYLDHPLPGRYLQACTRGGVPFATKSSVQ